MKNFAWIAFVSLLFFSNSGFAQSPSALDARKVQDYFQDVESKSYYQQERIRSMKGEMNEYSERLHGLQERFHKIFYGKSSDRLHQSPFGDREKISYPKRTYRKPMPMPEVESIVRKPEKYSQPKNESSKLAFTVDESGPSNIDIGVGRSDSSAAEKLFSQTDIDETISPQFGSNWAPAEVERPNSSGKGVYLIIKPGLQFPYKDQTTHNGPNKTKHRKYKPGFGVTLSGGYRYKGFNFGAGVLYRKNEHDSGSYEEMSSPPEPFANGSESKSIAGFVEVGYTHPFNSWFGLYSSLGLGYGVSVVEDFAPSLSNSQNRKRIDPFFFASGGIGAVFTPTDFLAISLGYRYLHESEVPAHALELGLVGKF